MSTGTGGTEAEGVPLGTDPQPPCSLHSCLDSVQLHKQNIFRLDVEYFYIVFWLGTFSTRQLTETSITDSQRG